MKRLLSWAIAVPATVVIAFACGGDDEGSGAGGKGGNDAGGGKGATGGKGGSGASGGSGATGGAGGGVDSGGQTELGAACSSDADCGSAGLTCLTPDSTQMPGGGPAGGYCTIACTQGSDCTQYAGRTICVNYGTDAAPVRFCAEGCDFGGSGGDPFKCHGRTEVACAALTSATGGNVLPTCVPQCNSDQDCGNGLFCSPATGVCSTTPATGDLVGSKCEDPTAETSVDTCKGFCSGLIGRTGQPPVTYRCSERCTIGAPAACGWGGPGSGKADASCIFVPIAVTNSGPGDRGSCGQMCDCNDDCRSPDLICTPASANLKQTTGRQGFCTISQQDDGGTRPDLPCGAGTDGAAGGGNDASPD